MGNSISPLSRRSFINITGEMFGVENSVEKYQFYNVSGSLLEIAHFEGSPVTFQPSRKLINKFVEKKKIKTKN